MAVGETLPTSAMVAEDVSDISLLSDHSELSECSDLSSLSSSRLSSPTFYPSPPPSQRLDSEQRSCGTSRARASGPDDSQDSDQPAKKKRRVGPKPRSTQHLDVSRASPLTYTNQQAQIDLLTKTLRTHRKIVVIAGAGISTSAGIPDFRSANGLFKCVQKKHNLKSSGKLLFDAAVYRDESLTASFHEMVRTLSEEATQSSPTPFHHMLARLAQDNRLSRLYTQNIDCIEASMPPLATQVPLNNKAPWPRTIQLHGSLEKMVCQKCRHLSDFQPQLFDGPDPPLCPACSETDAVRTTTGQRSHGVGKLRPRIVLYNEHNPDEEAIAAVMNSDIRSRPDALIVVGTSLKIPGVRRLVKNLCKVVRSRRNGITMWINNEPPAGKEFEDCWDLMVKGDCDEVARLVNLKRWDDNTSDVFDECNLSEVERVKQEQGPISVVVQTPKKKQKHSEDTGILTPASSHEENAEALPHKKPVQSLVNPASRGKGLKELLEASKPKTTKPKKPASEKAAPKKTRVKKSQQTSKITTFSKIIKSTKAGTAAAKANLTLDVPKDSKPMYPLHETAARYNGPIFPNLVSQDPASPSEMPQHSSDIISPSSTPKGMGGLLCNPSS